MKVIVGLGNPGEEYKDTRHNVGFRVVDRIFNSQFGNPNKFQISNSKFHKIFNSEITEGKFDDEKILLVKPRTFMNNSGSAVGKLVNNYQLQIASELIVVHDDITIDLGIVKISLGSGAGKHNGVRSIIDHLHSQDFIRVRLGIGRGEGDLKDVVLSRFRPDEQDEVIRMIEKSSEACTMLITDGVDTTMNRYN